MSAPDAELTLQQIIEVCEKAIEFRNSVKWKEFRDDWRKQMLGERLVEVLGEAVKRLPDDLRDRHPQLPWQKIASTRNYIAHGYALPLWMVEGSWLRVEGQQCLILKN